MQIQPVSFRLNSPRQTSFTQNGAVNNDIQRHFMYMPTVQDKKKNRQNLFLGLLTVAAIAVALTLLKINHVKKLPKTITDLEDKNLGLNKIVGYDRNIEDVKDMILYPATVMQKGRDETLRIKKLKSGLIVTGDKKENITKFMNAFVEHSEKLGITTKSIKGKNRSEKCKWIYREVGKAKALYEETGKPTILNIGDMADLSSLMINKAKKSRIESFLEIINPYDIPGVIWAGWTDKAKSIPCFYNNIPVLITKLAE